MAVVLLRRPMVEGRRVIFSWISSRPLEKIRRSTFYFEYVGMRVRDLPLWVHQSTGVCLLMAQLMQIPERHVLVVDGAVPSWVINLWSGYHAARNVAIVADPIEAALDGSGDEPGDEPAARAADSAGSPHFGVLFGGGKDSLFALDLIREAFPDSRISLLSYVHPPRHVTMADLERRRKAFAVSLAAKRYRADVIVVRTDARRVFDRPFHTELYTASMLPILYRKPISAVTFSYEYGLYWTGYGGGRRSLAFRRSRPEHCVAISRAYSRALGRRFDLFNANAFVSELSSFLYLARKRPSFAGEVMMCESTADRDRKWCRNCTKCSEYALFSAYARLPNTELPLRQFLADSPWIQRTVPEVRSRLAKTSDRAGRWFPGLSSWSHADSLAHVLARLAADPPQDLTGPALANLQLLVEAYARDLKENECAYEGVLRQTWPADLQERALDVVRTHLEVAATGPARRSFGTSSVVFDPQAGEEIPETHRPPFPAHAFAAEIAAVRARVDEPIPPPPREKSRLRRFAGALYHRVFRG